MDIPIESIILHGDFVKPKQSKGLVIFVHGSGSSRLSPRNQLVAKKLNQANFATLLFDLLTEEEEKIDDITKEFRFNIPLLTRRLICVTQFIQKQESLNVGYFGASTGAAAALIAAAKQPSIVKAVVSRGGRVDLAHEFLKKVLAASLFIVGGNDPIVVDLNQKAFNLLSCEKQLEVVPGATHLFEEKGKLEIVASLASKWFLKFL